MKSGNTNGRCWQGQACSEALGRPLHCPSFWWLQVILALPWLVAASSKLCLLHMNVFSPAHKNVLHNYPTPVKACINWVNYSSNELFSNQVESWGSTKDMKFWISNLQPSTLSNLYHLCNIYHWLKKKTLRTMCK